MSLSVCVCVEVCVQLCVCVCAYLLLLLSARGIKSRLVFESAARFLRASSSSLGINKKCTAVKFQPSVHVVSVTVSVCVRGSHMQMTLASASFFPLPFPNEANGVKFKSRLICFTFVR